MSRPLPTVSVPYRDFDPGDGSVGLAWCLHSQRPFARDLLLRCPNGHVLTLRSFERIGASPHREAIGHEIRPDGDVPETVVCTHTGCFWTAHVKLDGWAMEGL